jgi:soluble lytic murein transglycosylase-like protein
MKFTTIALSLGCTAAICGLAAQSHLFSFKPAHSQAFVNVRKMLDRSWLSLLNLTPGTVRSLVDAGENRAKATVLPLVSKVDALALISGSAAKYRVPAAFVASIVAAESDFDPTAVSSKGAIGLMQLMPDTAREFGADPEVPAENVDAGTHYLHWLMVRYRNTRGPIERVIAAYNAGPGMVDRYGGVPPFRETRSYVTRVLGFLKQFSRGRRT